MFTLALDGWPVSVQFPQVSFKHDDSDRESLKRPVKFRSGRIPRSVRFPLGSIWIPHGFISRKLRPVPYLFPRLTFAFYRTENIREKQNLTRPRLKSVSLVVKCHVLPWAQLREFISFRVFAKHFQKFDFPFIGIKEKGKFTCIIITLWENPVKSSVHSKLFMKGAVSIWKCWFFKQKDDDSAKLGKVY